MRIVQINTADKGGGAEGSALNLHRSYCTRGHESILLVGQKFTNEPTVIEIPQTCNQLLQPLLSVEKLLRRWNRRVKGMYPLTRSLERLANPGRLKEWWQGSDETGFADASHMLSVLPALPDVIHCHNLHGWYFDFGSLAELSKAAPVIVNLRDSWLLTGHCAYFLDCNHWQDGCGDCPRLGIYPRCRKDHTRENLQRKIDVLSRSCVYLTAPSQWLADQVAKSKLNFLPCNVIPNGIDTDIFRPSERITARQKLGLPLNRPIVMFAAAAATSLFKDAAMLWSVVKELGERRCDIQCVCVGFRGQAVSNVHCVPYVSRPEEMAAYYASADVFIHTAKENAEAFGKTVTEAMACGTPVVATATGGITEQILPGQTGYLVPPGDVSAATEAVLSLINMAPDDYAYCRKASAQRGAQFSLEAQSTRFLQWYGKLIGWHKYGLPGFRTSEL